MLLGNEIKLGLDFFYSNSSWFVKYFLIGADQNVRFLSSSKGLFKYYVFKNVVTRFV